MPGVGVVKMSFVICLSFLSYVGQPVTSFVMLSTRLLAVVAAVIAVVVVVGVAVIVVFSAVALSKDVVV